MDQNKDQIGAAVRAICSEKFEAFVNTLPDGMKKNIDDAKERGESLTETAFSIGFEAGQGAAVRGEAVAASNPTDLRLRITEVLMNRANGMSEDHLYFQRAPEDAKRPVSMLIAELVATVVSARAADAPSEPSEVALWDENGEPMNDAAEKEWRQCNERIRQRAADALDSQPTRPSPADAPPLKFRTLLEQCMVVLADAGWRSSPPIAGLRNLHEQIEKALTMEALDSQPTAPNNYHDAYRGARDDLADWKRRALSAEESCRKMAAAINAENGPTFMGELASSQPTDGGVRNG